MLAIVKLLLHLFTVVCLLAGPAHAIINFGLDNSGNTTAPGNGAPWGSVAEVTFFSLNDPRGSAVYLGNRYMITANHVDVNLSGGQVRFEPNGTAYDIDGSFTPVQIASGVDAKIFRLASDPGVPAVKLLDSPIEQVADATFIGWGIGRDPADPVNSLVVNWGATSTQDKRWGDNVLRAATPIAYSVYSFDALVTILGSDVGGGVGANEAAVTTLDSGGGLFQFLNGEWHLIGIATLAEINGTSTYALDTTGLGRGNANYFVRISDYAGEIEGIIPEPSAYAVLAGLFALLLVTRYRARLS